jgi:hypothetical protein
LTPISLRQTVDLTAIHSGSATFRCLARRLS